MKFDFWTIFSFIVCGGFFGGVASYLAYCVYGDGGDFRSEFSVSSDHGLGFVLLNGIIGIGGAFAIQIFVLGMRFYDDKTSPAVSDFVFLSSICVIGGFGARSFLTHVSRMFIEKVKQTADEAKATAERAESKVDMQERHVLVAYLQAALNDEHAPRTLLEDTAERARLQIEKDALDIDFVIIRGCALKRLQLYQGAVDVLTRYIDQRGEVAGLDKDLAAATYNRCCYLALLGRIEAALLDLERSLQLSERVEEDKAYARTDPDLVSSLGQQSRFRQMTET